MSVYSRRWLVVLVGASLLVGLAAVPLSAAKPTKKTYTVTVTPTSVPYNPAGVEKTFTLRYTNATPGGIASFNSLTLTAPDGFTIDPATVSAFTSSGNTGFSLATSSEAPNIKATNLYPVSYEEWVELTFKATVLPSATTCLGSVGTWVTEAWTGSNTSGGNFELQPPPPTTTVGTPLAPGDSITVNGVTLTNVGESCAPVTLSRDGNLVSVWKPADPSLAFTVEINAWDPEPADAPIPLARWTEVDTPSPSALDLDDDGWHPIQWCLGSADAPALPGSEVSCLISQSSVTYGPDGDGSTSDGITSPDWVPEYEGQLIQVTELIYLTGDWAIHR